MIISTGPCESIAILGNFNSTNFGNEITLAAIVDRLKSSRPNARLICICNASEEIAVANYKLETKSLLEPLFSPRVVKTPILGVILKLLIGLVNEAWHWVSVFRTVRCLDVLLFPGTGLLTDANGLRSWGWGPYYCFKWSLIARLLGRKIIFISVGAGPLYSRFGRFFIGLALSFAQFRSFRDQATKAYLMSIGFSVQDDPVYPDLVFGCSDALIPPARGIGRDRTVIGLGVMAYAGLYSNSRPSDVIQENYLACLAEFAKWAIASGNDVRILIGDLTDVNTKDSFVASLLDRLSDEEQQHLINEGADSVDEVLKQIAATDIVVATRFHTTLLALYYNKPVIAISFHHKCEALMTEMGLPAYALDFDTLGPDALVSIFCQARDNTLSIKSSIMEHTAVFRQRLDEQYNTLFQTL